jgi:hypothetical protein
VYSRFGIRNVLRGVPPFAIFVFGVTCDNGVRTSLFQDNENVWFSNGFRGVRRIKMNPFPHFGSARVEVSDLNGSLAAQ